MTDQALPEQINAERRPTAVTVLWAIHDRYQKPHVVRAWPHALEEVGYGLEDEIREAKEWMENWGDERGWRYWTTVEHITEPPVPDPAETEAWCLS